MSPRHLELIAALLGLISVWLIVKRRVYAFPIGIIMVSMYAWVFYQARLYADMMLQGVFVVMQIQGWIIWSRGEKAADQRILIRRLNPTQWTLNIAWVAAGSLGLGYVLWAYTNADIPWLDAFTTALSLLAQWRMNQRYVENWILWIVVDAVYLFQYTYKALYFTTALYALFLVMAYLGYRAWNRQLRLQQSGTATNAPPIAT